MVAVRHHGHGDTAIAGISGGRIFRPHIGTSKAVILPNNPTKKDFTLNSFGIMSISKI